jgi:hypothetical protein
VGAVAVLLALVLSPSARAGWSAPETVADGVDTGFVFRPTLVAGPHGRLAITWEGDEGIGLVVARRPGGFGAPLLLPRTRGHYAPSLGIDARGNTTIAWLSDYDCTMPGEPQETCGQVRSAVRLPGGRLAGHRTLTTRRYDSYGPSVAVAPGGRTVVWWGAGRRSGVGARVAARPGVFGPLALRGREIVTWKFAAGGRRAQVVLREKRKLVAVEWSPGAAPRKRRVLISVKRPRLSLIDAGSDGKGLRSAAWESEGGYRSPSSLFVATRMASGRLGSLQKLAQEPDGGSVYPVDVDSGRSGITVAAWAVRGSEPPSFGYPYPAEAELRAAVSLPGRRFGASQLLAARTPEQPLYGLATAAGPRSAVVTWRGTQPDGSEGIFAAVAGPHGHFGRTTLLSTGSEPAVSDPSVVVDSRGTPVVAWLEGLSVRVARLS